MKHVNLIFPHQLYATSPLDLDKGECFLVEEHLYFSQYAFHKQKLLLHRASMQYYRDFLTKKGASVNYIDAQSEQSDIRVLIKYLSDQKVDEISYVDTTDYLLERRITRLANQLVIKINKLDSPLFLNTKESLSDFFKPSKTKFFQTKFYIEQRKKFDLLIDQDGNPEGGKWSFDPENRKKYPKKKTPPEINYPSSDDYYEEAFEYIEKNYKSNPGSISDEPQYPSNHKDADLWLDQFLEMRFDEFGPYEDAIVASESILNHGVLTPMLNIGLLTPDQIIEKTVQYAQKHEIRINSTEGFIRQIIGWREFIRGLYELRGVEQRKTNYWGFDRKIPEQFYTGDTGIAPVDITIKKLLKSGYNHHIERLMVLGNFMLLCEFDPDEVYRWFMEMYIDAYDWVMVPNVYGMSQFADGGMMATKPYISGSNYLMKMSDYKKGDWQKTWDGLFWRFMHVHRDFFLSNPRLGMLVRMYDKMPEEKQNNHLKHANEFLDQLDNW